MVCAQQFINFATVSGISVVDGHPLLGTSSRPSHPSLKISTTCRHAYKIQLHFTPFIVSVAIFLTLNQNLMSAAP
jgi:hypothetical protein